MQIVLSLVSLYLLWNVFTFKFISGHAVLTLLAIMVVSMITGSKLVLSVSALAGIVAAIFYICKHIAMGVASTMHKLGGKR